jgi:hypothetical protein
VALTMGNDTPVADLMVATPGAEKEMFLVDVKGHYKRYAWGIRRKEAHDNLFYILAYVPDDGPNEFFILKQKDVHAYIELQRRHFGWSKDHKLTGISLEQAEKHKDLWDTLPAVRRHERCG